MSESKKITLGNYRGMHFQLEKPKEEYSRGELMDIVMRRVLEEAAVEMDEEVINGMVDGMLEDFRGELKGAGLSFEEYLEQAGQSEEELLKQLYQVAWETQKKSMVIAEIAQQEEIRPEPEQLVERVNAYAAKMEMDPKQLYAMLEQSGQLYQIYKEVFWETVTDYLVDCSLFFVKN